MTKEQEIKHLESRVDLINEPIRGHRKAILNLQIERSQAQDRLIELGMEWNRRIIKWIRE